VEGTDERPDSPQRLISNGEAIVAVAAAVVVVVVVVAVAAAVVDGEGEGAHADSLDGARAPFAKSQRKRATVSRVSYETDKATRTLERSTTHATPANREPRAPRRHRLRAVPLAGSIMAQKTRHAIISVRMLIK